MAYWCDDAALNREQSRLDAAQADARRRMDEAAARRPTQEEEMLAWQETQAWEG